MVLVVPAGVMALIEWIIANVELAGSPMLVFLPFHPYWYYYVETYESCLVGLIASSPFGQYLGFSFAQFSAFRCEMAILSMLRVTVACFGL